MISIILATYNERDNIVEMIKRIHASIKEPVEIIIVDDASSDGTADIVESLHDPSVKVIRRKTRGFASAIVRGIIESTGSIICWWDADMMMCPAVANEMIEHLDTYEIVIGSRYVSRGGDNREISRVFASRIINWLARVVLDYNIRDCDSGFIVMRRSVLDKVAPVPVGYGEYFIEFTYSAVKNGIDIFEYPYILERRKMGDSKTSPNTVRFLITGLKYVIRIFISKLRN